MKKAVLLTALGILAGCGGSTPAEECQTAECGAGATYQVCATATASSETFKFGAQSCTVATSDMVAVQNCAQQVADYCERSTGATGGTGGSGTGGTGGSGTGGTGGSGSAACTYTVSGAQTGTGTCTVLATVTPDSNGVAILVTGGEIFEFGATLSAQTALTVGTYTEADAAPGFGAEYVVGNTGAYLLCSTSGNCSSEGSIVPAQGSFSLTVSNSGPTQTAGGGTLWSASDGTLTVTMPEAPGGGVSGTVTVNVTF